MNAQLFLHIASHYILGWPFLILTLGVCIFCTIVLKGVQFRHFFTAWREVLRPSKADVSVDKADMSPLQAFFTMLNGNLGNGTLVGAASAIYSGGPGAVLWILVLSFLFMVLRFAEVYLSVSAGCDRKSSAAVIGGPMLYLSKVPGGRVLAYTYAVFCFAFCLIIGGGMQANTVSVSVETTWGVPSVVTALALFGFIMVIVMGGAQRIAKVSEKMIPLKLFVFMVSAVLVLLFHYKNILSAVWLIVSAAFTTRAAVGGLVGYSLMQALKFGMTRSIMGSEAGLGTAAILFGNTGSTSPVKDGLMAMLGTFIASCVSFIVGLCIVVSGVWSSGATSSALVIQSFATVFGQYAGWLVSFLAVTFGVGVLVTNSYVTRELWLFLTKGRGALWGIALYSGAVFLGSLLEADIVFKAGDLAIAVLLLINLFGILWLLPSIKKDIEVFRG